MATVFKTDTAADDLLEIWLFIAEDSIRSADKWIDTLNKTCKQLAANPHLGRLRKELAADLRSFPVENYVLFYKPVEEGILLVRVLHGSRDIDFYISRIKLVHSSPCLTECLDRFRINLRGAVSQAIMWL